MIRLKKCLAEFRRRLRRFAAIILFTIYIAIGIADLHKVENPRLTGGLYIAAAVAHLL